MYSLNSGFTSNIQSAVPAPPVGFSYAVEVVGSNLQIRFGSQGAFHITGAAINDANCGSFLFSGLNIAGVSITVPGFITTLFHVLNNMVQVYTTRVFIAGEEYQDLFYNTMTEAALASNDSRVSAVIRQGAAFAGTPSSSISFSTSTGITFNGILLMQLLQETTKSISLAADDQLLYMNGALSVISGGTQQFNTSGIQRLSVLQGGGIAINDGSASPSTGSGTLFVQGNSAFFTSDANTAILISNVISPLPSSLPLPVVEIVMVSGMPTLTISGSNIVSLNTSQVIQIMDGQSISYSNQVLRVSTSGSVNPVFTQINIEQFAFFPTGVQQVLTFTSSSLSLYNI